MLCVWGWLFHPQHACVFASAVCCCTCCCIARLTAAAVPCRPQGLKRVELRDELYMQLVKQTRGNPNPAARAKAWQLFYLTAATMPPSKDFMGLVSGALLGAHSSVRCAAACGDMEVCCDACNSSQAASGSNACCPSILHPCTCRVCALVCAR